MTAPHRWNAVDASAWVTVPRSADDKYSRGVLGLATGSDRYPGAAVLGVEAALRTGVGMVRYSGPQSVGQLVLQRRPEAVLDPGHANAWVLGSGVDMPRFDEQVIAPWELTNWGLAPSPGTAFVLDAAAIGMGLNDLGPTIVTPHAGELARFLGVPRADVEAAPIEHARRAAGLLDAVVLLKGATTHVVVGDQVAAVREAPPWLATAGAGDALAGVLGALVAARAARLAPHPLTLEDLFALGATAAFLHGRAATLAAGMPAAAFTILDLCAALPEAMRGVLA